MKVVEGLGQPRGPGQGLGRAGPPASLLGGKPFGHLEDDRGAALASRGDEIDGTDDTGMLEGGDAREFPGQLGGAFRVVGMSLLDGDQAAARLVAGEIDLAAPAGAKRVQQRIPSQEGAGHASS
ncbi:MAG: hypothetical protein Q9Q13_03670 [Acidobacteriota bacterium]|nr:hypothetical protein [Acidobacteriota bacterium]